MLLLLYCLPLMFKVWQRSGSCCCCSIVYHYSLRFDRGVVHVVVVILVNHDCLGFERRVIHVVVVILSAIAVQGLPEGRLMLLWLAILSTITL